MVTNCQATKVGNRVYARLDLDIYRRDTFDLVLEFTDDNENPIDFADATLLIQFRTGSPSGAVVKTITETDGASFTDNKIVFNTTFDFPTITLYYDIQVTFSGNIVRTLVKGLAMVEDDTSHDE